MRIGGDHPILVFDQNQRAKGFDFAADKGNSPGCCSQYISPGNRRYIDPVIVYAARRRAKFGNHLTRDRPHEGPACRRSDELFARRRWHRCGCLCHRLGGGRLTLRDHAKTGKIRFRRQDQPLADNQFHRHLAAICRGKLLLADAIALSDRTAAVARKHHMKARR